jgi:hypothetical protein
MARKAPAMSPGMTKSGGGKTAVASTMKPVFAGRKGRRGGRR